jgi:hypothetical protein
MCMWMCGWVGVQALVFRLPKVTYSYLKYLWTAGNRRQAYERLNTFTTTLSKREVRPNPYTLTPYTHREEDRQTDRQTEVSVPPPGRTCMADRSGGLCRGIRRLRLSCWRGATSSSASGRPPSTTTYA